MRFLHCTNNISPSSPFVSFRMESRSKWVHYYVVLCLSISSWEVVHAKTRWEKAGFQTTSEMSRLNTTDWPKLVLVICGGESTKIGNTFDRQINQTLTLIKSVFITMERDDSVHVILISSKKKHFEKIKTEIKKYSRLVVRNEQVQLICPSRRVN